jgi:signal transduction histidine kinase
MKKPLYEEHIRLAVVIPYYIFHLPILIRFLLPAGDDRIDMPPNRPVLLVLIVCFLIYLTLELVEYMAFRYRKQGRCLTLLFTGIRLLAWGFPVLMAFLTPGVPIFDLLIPFFIFSLYFVMPVRYSFGLLVASVLYTVLIFLLREEPTADRIAWFMLIPRSMIAFILYAFAHFWDSTRRNREKLTAWADGIGHQVALEERTRLARDIHDNLGHYMTVIQIQLSKADAFFDRDPSEARASVQYARDAAREAMGEIRQSLDTLNSSEGGFVLKEEILRLAEPLKRNSIKVGISFEGEQEGCNYAVLLALYRMIQEGVTNILKHAGATEVQITVDLSGTASIRDNGRGLPGDLLAGGKGSGFGLTGLANRFALVQGRFTVSAMPEGGTLLSAEFPRDPVKSIRG